MGLPDFICIGAHKGGTTWLSVNLRQHPQVWTPFNKELHFFDAPGAGSERYFRRVLTARLDGAIEAAQGAGAPQARIDHLRRLREPAFMLTPDWYRLIFSQKPAGMTGGEYTPRYSTLSEEAIGGMLAFLPRTRFIYLIREPVGRALSNFRMAAERAGLDPADRGAIDAFTREWVGKRRYFSGDYADFIPRWDARCAEGERILYLPFGAIRERPRALLAEVERFLGLTPFDGYETAEEPVHKSLPIAPPDWLRGHLEADLAPHRAFLERRFPKAFTDLLS
ncbi:MAG: sulfotransferase [Pikeienuella sp.]